MNPLRPGKDESILTDFRRTFPLLWSLQTLFNSMHFLGFKTTLPMVKISHQSSHCHFLDKKQIIFQIMVACLSSTELVAVVHFVIVCWGAKTITGWGVWSYAVWDLSAFWPIETAKHIWSGFGIWNRLLIHLDIFENTPTPLPPPNIF